MIFYKIGRKISIVSGFMMVFIISASGAGISSASAPSLRSVFVESSSQDTFAEEISALRTAEDIDRSKVNKATAIADYNATEYVVRDPEGRYYYSRTSSGPSMINDDWWRDAGGTAFPFEEIDAGMLALIDFDGPGGDAPEACQIYINGIEYILWTADRGYFSFEQGDAPGYLGDDFWGDDFPELLSNGMDAAMEVCEGGLQLFTCGNEFISWDSQGGYSEAGTIKTEQWPFGGANFPFETIDSMEPFYDPDSLEEIIIFVSGDEYALYDLDTNYMGGGIIGDDFWVYRWQGMPFADRDAGIDAMIKSDYHRTDPDDNFEYLRLTITSNTPVRRKSVKGRFIAVSADTYDSKRAEPMDTRGSDHRILYLNAKGSPFDQGAAHGYLLAEEISALLNDELKSYTDEHIGGVDVEIRGITVDAEGYEAIRQLAQTLFNLDDESNPYYEYYSQYHEELEGMLRGIRMSDLVIPRIGLVEDTRVYTGENSRELDVWDLYALHIYDDLHMSNCKSAALWQDGLLQDRNVHGYVMDWFSSWATHNIIIVYGNEGDPKNTWVTTSYAGHIGGFLWAMNEKALSYSGIAAAWWLRDPYDIDDTPQDRMDWLNLRVEALVDSLPDNLEYLVPITLMCRHVVENASTVEGGYDFYRNTNTMSPFGLHVVRPLGNWNGEPSVIYETYYPGVQAVWSEGEWPEGHGFFKDWDSYNGNADIRYWDDPGSDNAELYPLFIATPGDLRKVYTPPLDLSWDSWWYNTGGAPYGGWIFTSELYSGIQDDITEMLDAGVFIDKQALFNIMKNYGLVSDPDADPWWRFAGGLVTGIHLIVAEPKISCSGNDIINESSFIISFAHANCDHAFHYEGSGYESQYPATREYTWNELINLCRDSE